MNKILAGLLAGIPLASVFVLYMLVRGKALVSFFKDQDESFARISGNVLFMIILGCFVGAAFLFGMLAGLVYSWLGAPVYFTAMGLCSALVLSVLAVVSKTPLSLDKIVWNLAVGGLLGLLVPLFSQL